MNVLYWKSNVATNISQYHKFFRKLKDSILKIENASLSVHVKNIFMKNDRFSLEPNH